MSNNEFTAREMYQMQEEASANGLSMWEVIDDARASRNNGLSMQEVTDAARASQNKGELCDIEALRKFAALTDRVADLERLVSKLSANAIYEMQRPVHENDKYDPFMQNYR